MIRVNFDKADPPREVIDSFRAVQAAQQERDRLEKEADAYANRVTAGARGEAARLMEEAEAYRAQVVNNAEGEASRFLSVYDEYVKAPEVTRRRMYLETMENVLGGMNKVILDGVSGGEGGQGVVPYPAAERTGPMPGAAQPRRPLQPEGPTDEQDSNHSARICSLSGALALSSVFIVDEREKALVLQFGQVKAVKEDPGLGFKMPFIQEVVTYDDRILGLPTQPLEVTPAG